MPGPVPADQTIKTDLGSPPASPRQRGWSQSSTETREQGTKQDMERDTLELHECLKSTRNQEISDRSSFINPDGRPVEGVIRGDPAVWTGHPPGLSWVPSHTCPEEARGSLQKMPRSRSLWGTCHGPVERPQERRGDRAVRGTTGTPKRPQHEERD